VCRDRARRLEARVDLHGVLHAERAHDDVLVREVLDLFLRELVVLQVVVQQRVVFRQKLAEIAGEYLKKGSQVYIEGRLRTRKWQDKDGQEKYTTEIIAERMQMLGARSGAGEPRSASPMESKAAEPKSAAAKKPAGKFDDMEDDIPF